MADRKQRVQLAIGLAICAIVLGIWIWIEQKPVERVSPPPGKALVIDKSAAAQSERKALLDRLMAEGLVREVDSRRAGSIRVALRPAFYKLDEPTREKYLSAIYAYYFDGSSVNDTIILRDARHGNNIGRYNPYGEGLVMYK